jgi:hypothetical protein
LIAENHHGIVGLSSHISKILDEVYDFQAVKKNVKAQKEPDADILDLIAEIDKETDKLCKYDSLRCDLWTKKDKLKEKAKKKKEEEEKKLEKLKGTEKDPSLKKGPGGYIPKGLDEIKEEKKLAEEKKELDDAKKKEAEEKGESVDCVECARKERKKNDNITKGVSEPYDVEFKGNQTRTNGSIVWGGNQHETIPNPTVYPHERKIIEGRHPDEDINNAAKNAKTTKVYPPGNEPDSLKKQHTDAEKVQEDKKRADEVLKAEVEGG